MFEFSATPDRSGMIIADGAVNAAQTQARTYNQFGDNIGAALEVVGAAYDKDRKRRQELAAMGKAVGMFKDMGVIDQDTLEKFNNARPEVQPMLFGLLQEGPLKLHIDKQRYEAQAKAWADYRTGQPRNRDDYTVTY